MKPYETIKGTAAINANLIDYHLRRGFRIYNSFPLISDDPTLIFTNATITPFKHLFMKEGMPHNYALVQHCLRVGGGAGDLSLAMVSPNYSSLFEMFGSGYFGVSHTEAVGYFIGMLTHVGIPFENLWFTTPKDDSFHTALTANGVDTHKIFELEENGDFWHSWKFGKGGLLGSGITAIHVAPNTPIHSLKDIATLPEICIEIGNLIHIFGREGENGEVVPISNTGFEVGMGSARLAVILEKKTLWELSSFHELLAVTKVALEAKANKAVNQGVARIITDHLRTISTLILNNVRPGAKRESFVLRKMIRTYSEFVWLAEQKISETSDVVRCFTRVFSLKDIDQIVRIVTEEEKVFRAALKRGADVMKNGLCTDPNELMSTYGVRASLVSLLATME